MNRPLATLLLDFAARIAPRHRRDWIAGLRAEAGITDHPTAWAWGALTTAIGQRVADTVASGLAARLVMGGFVIGLAACMAITLAIRLPDIEAVAARTHKNLLPPILLLGTAVLALASGGLAILISRGTSWFNRYGRLLFAAGGVFTGLKLTSAVFAIAHGLDATALQHQTAILSTIAGPFFIAAALALLFRRGPLFLILASGAFGLEVLQYGAELSSLRLPAGPLWFVAFLSACAPGLIMLAASGLLIERKPLTNA